MLVKWDPGLLKAHILMKFGCCIPIHSKYVQFLPVPKYQYSLYHFKWCLYKLLTDLYCDESEVKKYYELIPSTFVISETSQFLHTCANLLALHSVKWFSFSDSLFLIWCVWHQYNPVEMTFHSIVDCLCTCTLWIVFIQGIVRWWTFQMPISSLTFASMISCKTAFLRNTSSLGGIWFLVAIFSWFIAHRAWQVCWGGILKIYENNFVFVHLVDLLQVLFVRGIPWITTAVYYLRGLDH